MTRGPLRPLLLALLTIGAAALALPPSGRAAGISAGAPAAGEAPPEAAGPSGASGDTGEEHSDEGAKHGAGDPHSSRLSDELIPLQIEGFPERPPYLLELGNPYLGTGRIKRGIQLPTGAVWQPSLIAFGNLRTAVQTFDDDGRRVTEIATRLDLFANLQLSGTERLVVGFRNFDRDGRFTSYILDPDPDDPEFRARFGDDDRFREELNAEIQSLFFEGDFGEIFPNLDKEDFGRTDVGFSIGRQPLQFQEGILIEDSLDGLGITRNTLLPSGTSNFRATLFLAVDDVHRANVEDESAELLGLLTSTDFRRSTVDADLVWVRADDLTGDQANLGVSAVQRIGHLNTGFRVLGSWALDRETPWSTNGALLFSEISWTPRRTHDLAYVNTFVAIEEFSSAARGPSTGGPLGRAGISFAAVGLGSYGAPLVSRARDVAGGAVGYQKFFGKLARRQLLAEVGVRVGLDDRVGDDAAATVRYQAAYGRRLVLVFDAFASSVERFGGDRARRLGGRFEVLVKF